MPRLRRSPTLVIAALLLFAACPAGAQDAAKPTPRLESVKNDRAFGRRGPGTDHKVDWTYTRKGLPVVVLQESEGGWRKIRDPEGGVAWMHASMLSSARTVYVADPPRRGAGLYASPRPQSRLLARLGPGVVGRLEGCLGDWRRIKVEERSGWVDAKTLWGADDCVGVD